MRSPLTFFVIGLPKGQPDAAPVIWGDIPGYETLYQVSALGAVRRHPGVRKLGNVVPGAILKQALKRNGYCAVQLFKEGKGTTHLVHRLVASAYLGSVVELQVNHINGKKSDNRACNLELTTPKENYAHAIRTGLAPTGDRNGSVTKPESRPRGDSSGTAKLTSTQVLEIRSRRSNGESLIELAHSFGVCFQAIHAIVTRKTWGHL